MSLLKLAQAAVPQGLPCPGIARVWVEVSDDVRTSKAGNLYVPLKIHGVGHYEKSTVLGQIMLTADANANWSLMGARQIAAIARVSGRSLEGTLLTAEETPEVSDEGIDQLLELIAEGEAIVRLKTNDKGYKEVAAWLDPEEPRDAAAIAILGEADAIVVEERASRGRPAPAARTARAGATAPAPRTAPAAAGATDF